MVAFASGKMYEEGNKPSEEFIYYLNPTEHVGYVARTDDKRPVQCATILGRLEKVELYNIYIGSPPKIPENGTSYTCNALRYLHKSRKHTMRYL